MSITVFLLIVYFVVAFVRLGNLLYDVSQEPEVYEKHPNWVFVFDVVCWPITIVLQWYFSWKGWK